MRYAIFGFSTPNLGDDVQALAAALLLPRVDAYVDRDRLDQVRLDGPHHLIMNSWFAIKRYTAVPSSSIVPHYFGQCVGRPELLNETWLKEWRDRGPIGVRDTGSLALLKEHGINAYYSGCLTTWMGRFIAPPKRRNGIVFLDVPEAIETFIPAAVRQNARRISNDTPKGDDKIWRRLRRTAEVLDILRGAEMVVTRRLHTALPCVGFGTPVTVYLEGSAPNRHRFSGTDQFVPVIYHDGVRPIDGPEWIEPQAVRVPTPLENGFQALLGRLGTQPAPRWQSMVEFVDTLPDIPRAPYGLMDRVLGNRGITTGLRPAQAEPAE